jgi:hypothetical protein
MAQIDGTQALHWYICPVGTLMDGAFYQVADAIRAANALRARGIPCELHRLGGPGLPLWTLKLLPLAKGQDTYPFVRGVA